MKSKRLASFILCVLMLLGTLAACATDNSGKNTQNGEGGLLDSDADSGEKNRDNQDTPTGGEQDTDESDPGENTGDPDPDKQDGEIQYTQLVAKVGSIEDGVYTLLGYESDADYETLNWAQFDAAAFTEGTQTYQMLPDTSCKIYTYNDSGEAIEATAGDIAQDCFLRIQYGSTAQEEDTQGNTLYILAYEIYILPAGGEAA